MTTVHVLQHVHEQPGGDEDVRLIGVYTTDEAAQRAIERLRGKPGFHRNPDGFHIDAYDLDRDHWTEGFGPGIAPGDIIDRGRVVFDGGDDGRVILAILGRQSPYAELAWDRDLLDATVVLVGPRLTAHVHDNLRVADLARFRDALREVDRTLVGFAVLEPLGGCLRIEVRVDRLGHLSVRTEIAHVEGDRASLTLRAEPAALAGWLRSLDELVAGFPPSPA